MAHHQIKSLEKKLGYVFRDPSLLSRALSHRSVGKDNNERLEFLGDALLGVIISDTLYNQYQGATEGELSRMRSSLVKGDSLAEIAREFDLGDFVLLGEGELKSGGFRRASILADCVEAIIGAIFLDSNFDNCSEVVSRWYQSRLVRPDLQDIGKDAKTQLQEYLQQRKLSLPIYAVIDVLGEDHAREYMIECQLPELKLHAKAKASSKRHAEKLAAAQILELINES